MVKYDSKKKYRFKTIDELKREFGKDWKKGVMFKTSEHGNTSFYPTTDYKSLEGKNISNQKANEMLIRGYFTSYYGQAYHNINGSFITYRTPPRPKIIEVW